MSYPVRNDYVSMTDDLYQYLLSVSLRETDLQARLRKETEQGDHAGMQLAPEQAQFLALLIKLMGAKRVLEIGVFTGYSSLTVASALPDDGQMIACDVNESWTALARRYWQDAGLADKIDLRIAPATATLQALLEAGEQNTFDFAFIDADKSNYLNYVNLCGQLLRPGGLIALDNMLWDGAVIDAARQDVDTQAIRDTNTKMLNDERFDLSLVPIGDGLTLLRKR